MDLGRCGSQRPDRTGSREPVREIVARGWSNWEIADEFRISPSRVCQIIRVEELWPKRQTHPPLSFEKATRIAERLGGFGRRRKVNGNIYLYAVKSQWRDGKVRQEVLDYLGPSLTVTSSKELARQTGSEGTAQSVPMSASRRCCQKSGALLLCR